jgi:hypothetical protein
MKQFLKWVWSIIGPKPVKFKTRYRGWCIEITGKNAVISKGQERFYASPRLGTGELVRFCKRKIDRLENTVKAVLEGKLT